MNAAQVGFLIGQEVMAGFNRKKLAKRQGKAAAYTGQALLQQASDIELVGGMEELEFREQAEFDLADIEALYAAAGVGPTGSALDVMLAAKRRFETDALKLREGTRRQAEASRGQAEQSFLEAEYARDAARHSFFGLF